MEEKSSIKVVHTKTRYVVRNGTTVSISVIYKTKGIRVRNAQRKQSEWEESTGENITTAAAATQTQLPTYFAGAPMTTSSTYLHDNTPSTLGEEQQE